jgi:hypothetical protein
VCVQADRICVRHRFSDAFFRALRSRSAGLIVNPVLRGSAVGSERAVYPGITVELGRLNTTSAA